MTQPPTTPDLLDRARRHLVQCGPCDYGMTGLGCNCPPGDPRSVIQDLVTEVERLRGHAAQTPAAADIQAAIDAGQAGPLVALLDVDGDPDTMTAEQLARALLTDDEDVTR